MQVNAFVLERPPQTLDHAIVDPSPLAVHADLDLRLAQYIDPVAAGELAALIGVEDLGRAMTGDSPFQSFNAELSVHTVGQPPRQNLAAVPVHDRHKVQEAAPHRDVGDVCAPDRLGRPITTFLSR